MISETRQFAFDVAKGRFAAAAVTAATLSRERQEMRGMLGAIAVWPEVADVCTYVRTYGLSGFRDKEFVEPWPFDPAAARLPNAPRTDRRRCDVRHVHPRAILARAARTCRAREREKA